jgi:hypothetical protein
MIAHVRNLVQDLVERRLWPVALVLAVALAAVPVVLGRGGDTAGTTAALPAAPAAASGDAEKAQITLDTGAPADDQPTDGHVRNPFKGPHAASDASSAAASPSGTSAPTADASSTAGASSPAAAPSTAPSGASSASSGATSSSARSTSTTGSTGRSTTATPKTPARKKTTKAAKPKAVDATDTYHVSLRFGVDGAALKTIKDVARLSPLPSETDPFFVFLGVLQTETTHEQRAVFMVSSDAVPTGEGACHPTKQDCETIELAKGQTVFFDYTAPDGTPTQYQLELAGIHKTQITSAAKAQAAIARHSAVGQELLRDAATRNDRAAAGARFYRFVPATGLLVRAKRRHVTARAAAAGAIPGLALVDRKDQPGIPVWHSPRKRAHRR